jgi:hypothetical protein
VAQSKNFPSGRVKLGRMGHRSIQTCSAVMFSTRLLIVFVSRGSKVLRAFMHFGTLPEVLGKLGLTTQIGAEALAAQQHQHDGKYLHARYEAGRTSSRYRLSRGVLWRPVPSCSQLGERKQERSGQLKWKSKRLKELLG